MPSRFQFGLTSLFGVVTFAAVMFWLASLGTWSCILAIAIVKHVLVAWLCMWYMERGRTAAERWEGLPADRRGSVG